MLGGAVAPPDSIERQRFETLRSNLAGGGLAARVYRDWLTEFLRRVDRFFGDKGADDGLSDDEIAARTLFPRFLGLVTPAPLWTAPSFDRCLLLALAYPLGALVLGWVASGHVGLAENAVGLKEGVAFWQRALIGFAVAFEITVYRQAMIRSGWKSLAWLVVAVAVFGVGAGAGAVAGAGAGAATGAVAFAFVGAVAVAVAGAVVGAGAGAGAVAGAGVVAFAFAFAFAVAFLDETAKGRNAQGRFLSFFTIAAIAGCLSLPRYLSHTAGWDAAGPLLLFLGLLTVINAPFDWLSLGLTRGLLRRGLEKGGWAPFGFGLLDATLAVVVIALLAAAMVLGVQIFDLMAVQGGGAAILPLRPLFDGMAKNPSDSEFWWIYFLLLSTMIPSLLNLAIGGTSLLRGLPRFPARLLKSLEPGRRIAFPNRVFIALELTSQWAIGTALAVTVQIGLLFGFIFHVLPWLGIEFLDIYRHLIFE